MRQSLKDFFFSSQGFSILFTLSIIAIFLVLFRMKTVELDYEITRVNNLIKKARMEGKELSAKRARMLSIKNLRIMAKKYNLNEPRQNQIIVIP